MYFVRCLYDTLKVVVGLGIQFASHASLLVAEEVHFTGDRYLEQRKDTNCAAAHRDDNELVFCFHK